MKRFQFRLDRILKIREHYERQWEIRMGDATRACLELEGELSALAEERSATVAPDDPGTRIDDPLVSPVVDVADRIARQRYIEFIDRRAEEVSESLVAREMEREEIRSKLAEASKDRKVLDKLKERRGDDYYRNVLRHTGNALDEIAGSAAVRSRLKGDGRV